MTARECALKVLYQLDQNGAYSDGALKKELAGGQLSPVDRAFATELAVGVVKHRARLDYVIQHYSKYKLKKLTSWILNILRLGVYQLLLLDKIPPSAAVNESVKLARRYGHGGSAGFVNGLLRTVVRQGDVNYPQDRRDYLATYYSHPRWMVDLFCDQYGEEQTEQLLAANNQTPRVTVRVNCLKTTGAQLAKQLREQGIEATETDCDNMLAVSKTGDIGQLSAFRDGLFTPQDVGAYRAALAVQPQPGDVILDVCAAPGGKTTALAELCGDRADITALDIHPHRVELIAKNAARLGLAGITATVGDASQSMPQYAQKADKVLADVPCSGLGILRKKPDVKWNRTPQDIAQLMVLQRDILTVSSGYVKPGGTLVYATCTVNRDENQGVTHPFVQGHPFEVVEETTLLPHRDGCDGFYICVLRRTDHGSKTD